MTGPLVWKILVIAGYLVLAGWLYWLTAKVLLLLTYGEQLLGMGTQLLGTFPGKSAERTDAADDEQPRTRFATLRAFAALRDRFDALTAPVLLDEDVVDEDLVDDDVPAPPQDPDEVELHRWADDGGRVPSDDPPPTPLGPPTVPMARAWDSKAARAYLDDVDRQLARFTFAEGHTR